jgi:hypothetical protein
LRVASDIPEYVANIKTPDGLVLAANYRYNNLHELEGDIQALRLVDLDREGLAEYRAYLQRLGISFNANAAFDGSSQFASAGGAIAGGSLSISSGGSYGAADFGGASTTIISSGGGSSSGSASAMAAEIFNAINTNGDNSISIQEAERAFLRLNSRLGRNYGEDDVKSFISAFDINRDGALSFEEFKRAILRIIG